MMNFRRKKTKRILAGAAAVLLILAMAAALLIPVSAAESASSSVSSEPAGDVILSGITLNGEEIGGKTAEEAESIAEQYVTERQNASVTLNGRNEGQSITVSAKDLGLSWTNEGVVEQIASLGHGCNVIARYKENKDLEENGSDFSIELGLDESTVADYISSHCASFGQDAVNGKLERVNGAFQVTGAQAGYQVDAEQSAKLLCSYILTQWNGGNISMNLEMKTIQPQGSEEELSQMTDVLGTFTTYYATDNQERAANIENGCSLINGTVIYPGQEFSVLDTITPFTADNGYYLAGSYVDNELVNSFGGGICQVSTTLYNAVIRAELTILERYNHTMLVTYVDPSDDAAIAESAGMDLRFRNTLEHPVYIEGIAGGGAITFNVYGVETRDAGRTISFESETLEEIASEGTEVRTDATQPIGYTSTTPGHNGMKAQLWKVVSENGEEVSREVFNKSEYSMTPTIIRVGTAGTMTQELQAAIDSKDVSAIETAAADAANGIDTAAASAAAAAAQTAAQDAYDEALAEGQDNSAAQAAAQAAAEQSSETSAAADTSADATAETAAETSSDTPADTTVSDVPADAAADAQVQDAAAQEVPAQ